MEQLINSGLSIKESLEIISIINDKKDSGSSISLLLMDRIQKGDSFASAINSFPEIFTTLYCGIIAVGDKVGSIENIFPRLRLYLETQKKVKDKIAGAMIYPSIVLITTIISFFAMILFVFPKLKNMFLELGGEASIILENNINKIEFFFVTLLILFFLVSISFLGLKTFSKKNKKLKFLLDSFILKLPIIGKFFIYFEMLNFSFAMETLTSGGVTIENAIKESDSVISNEKIREALKDVNTRIFKGESLSFAFSINKIFPTYISKWMTVGEKSGKPDLVFAQIRNFFQNEIDLYTSKFMALLEPILIVFIGFVLAILIITIIVPVFSLYGSIL